MNEPTQQRIAQSNRALNLVGPTSAGEDSPGNNDREPIPEHYSLRLFGSAASRAVGGSRQAARLLSITQPTVDGEPA